MTIGTPLVTGSDGIVRVKFAISRGTASSRDANKSDSNESAFSQNFDGVETEEIEIVLATSSDMQLDTGGSLWHASLVLCQYLCDNPQIVASKSVLEVGCGCGLVGLLAKALGAELVVLTDLPQQLPVVQQNIELNHPPISTDASAFTVRGDNDRRYSNRGIFCNQLEFGKALLNTEGDYASRLDSSTDCSHYVDHDYQQFDVVLGSDIGYDLALHEPLLHTVKSSCKRSGRVLIAEEIRWKDIHQWFLESMFKFFPASKQLEDHKYHHNGDADGSDCDNCRLVSVFESTNSSSKAAIEVLENTSRDSVSLVAASTTCKMVIISIVN